MARTQNGLRHILAGVLAGVVFAAGFLAFASPAGASPTAAPARGAISGSQFNPGNIISDALFYDGRAMTQAEIQTFLDAKIGRCTNGRCLNIINISIANQPAYVSDATGRTACTAVTGGAMKAAAWIYRVQVACGISAKVILVTLQKEQGLTTSKAPSDYALRFAMGMNCPDSSGCSSTAAGLASQIYRGTRQLKIYKSSGFSRQPGYHTIAYNPNTSCGGKLIRIQNYATAALYNYTPYQPNAAALANLGGTGNSCSSYGNRNFWHFYTMWFGSTQSRSAGWIDSGAAVFGTDSQGDVWLYAVAGGKWKPRGLIATGFDYENVLGVGDIDGDGHRDFLAIDSAQVLWLLTSDGINALSDPRQIATGWNYVSTTAVGDLDRDGRVDLVVQDAAGTLSLVRSDGRGGLEAPVAISSGWNAFTAIVGPGDFSGDGKRDVIGRDSTGKLWLFRGDGAGGLRARTEIAGGWNIFDTIISTGDFNGDKRADLFAIKSDGTAWVYKGNGAGKYTAPGVKVGTGWQTLTNVSDVGPAPGAAFVVQVGVGDLNSDGRRDIVVREATTGNVWLYRGKAGNTWNGRVAISVDWSDVRFAEGVGDLDGDGTPDVITVSDAGVVMRYPSNKVGGFGTAVQITTGWQIYDAVSGAGDLTSDRVPDVLTRDAAGKLWLHEGDGAGGFAAPRQVGTGWTPFNIVSVGDWDGDRVGDVMAIAADGRLWLYPGNGSGGWLPQVQIGTNWTIMDDVVGPGDWNADGRTDLIARDKAGKLWLYPGNGGGGYGTRVALGHGWSGFDLML